MDLNAEAAGYLLMLERRVVVGELTLREALQKAFNTGAHKGAIDGLQSAKEIMTAARKP